MRKNKHAIKAWPCFEPSRLILSPAANALTSVLLGELQFLPWLGKHVWCGNRPLRIIRRYFGEKMAWYVLVFFIDRGGAVRPLFVGDTIVDFDAFVRDLPALIHGMADETLDLFAREQ